MAVAGRRVRAAHRLAVSKRPHGASANRVVSDNVGSNTAGLKSGRVSNRGNNVCQTGLRTPYPCQNNATIARHLTLRL
ncbi:putative homing endonuclease [Xanthomonas phage Langgrundblatt2]|uniref:Homing endonuclease n=1 Tax=Xanthomonas phage Langgrundblatt2 TaxID=2939129 RepID=A0A9E7E109_9CAUD|nr:putative homing endonuclease [Xanthomonas phage Langgrundblatt2]URA06889.1 putative homing endonuclease [Xanthomonas phage Langgrundblatt2]